MTLIYSLSQETTDDHPHLDAVIAALGRVQQNGERFVYSIWTIRNV